MARQLHITVSFLNGRYHGEEWPPSPARLFQALLAGAVAGCGKLKNPDYQKTLGWLQNIAPPTIVATEVTRGFSYRVFSPSNDSDAPGIVALLCSGLPLADSIRKLGMLTQKTFQPRFAPDLGEIAVRYVWSLPEDKSPESERLSMGVCRLAKQMLSLGWGIDSVVGNSEIHEGNYPLLNGLHYLPDPRGNVLLKGPAVGFLDDLEQAYAVYRQRTKGPAVTADTRAKAYSIVRYNKRGDRPQRMFVAFELRDETGKWRAFPWESGMLVASWMRHAAKKRFKIEGEVQGFIDAYVSGHQAKGHENSRLSYVPLPSIGHEHSDGKHRRLLVILPSDDDGSCLPILARMAGDELVSIAGETMGWLAKTEMDAVTNMYIKKSKTWLSVTPVVLHGMVSDNGRFRHRKAEKLIMQAYVESGYPADNIEEFSYQPAPFWRGSGAASRAQVPKHLSNWPRYHVRVVFKEAVKGPILAGIGRHYGLGVFAASE